MQKKARTRHWSATERREDPAVIGLAAALAAGVTVLFLTGPRPEQTVSQKTHVVAGRRIAELAAEGLTNREIAQTLFITARTVEGHLTHVFTKLDVAARSEPRAALSAPTQADRASTFPRGRSQSQGGLTGVRTGVEPEPVNG